MKIALDLDDVVLDFGGRVIEAVNTEYNTALSISDVTDWNFGLLLDPIIGEDWWGWWEQRSWLWATAKAIPGAIGGIRTLRSQGHFIEIVTAKPEWAEAGTWQWLGKWKPAVHRVTIGPARPAMLKSEWSDADILVDDKPGNVEEWMESGREAILYDRPHNAGAFEHDKIRAFDWQHVLSHIEELSYAATR